MEIKKIEQGYIKEIINLWHIYLEKIEILNPNERKEFVGLMENIRNPICIFDPKGKP